MAGDPPSHYTFGWNPFYIPQSSYIYTSEALLYVVLPVEHKCPCGGSTMVIVNKSLQAGDHYVGTCSSCGACMSVPKELVDGKPLPEPTCTIKIESPKQGWQCPVCKGVFAPFVAQCLNCKPKDVKGESDNG